MLRLKLEFLFKGSEKHNGVDNNLAKILREEKSMNMLLWVAERCNGCNELKNKNQLNATYYFIVLIGSTCFGHYYAHHQELATVMLCSRSFLI